MVGCLSAGISIVEVKNTGFHFEWVLVWHLFVILLGSLVAVLGYTAVDATTSDL